MSNRQNSGISRIEEIIATVEGVVGVAAWQIDQTASKTPILINADQLYPTASTIKVPILYELYKQVEAGVIELNRRYEIDAEHFVPGSGVLQDLSFGLNPTVRDLAVLMTIVSDNTATDLLLDLLGRAHVEKTMRQLGLNQIFVAMTIREMLYSLAGLDVKDPTHTYQMAREIFDHPKYKVDPDCRALGETDNDLATPYEMAQLLSLVARHETLSAKSCEEILDILSRQKFNQIIPLYMPPGTRVSHKTGSINGVRNDVGVVYAPGMSPYVVALMSKRLANEVDGVQKLALISGAVYEYFKGE